MCTRTDARKQNSEWTISVVSPAMHQTEPPMDLPKSPVESPAKSLKTKHPLKHPSMDFRRLVNSGATDVGKGRAPERRAVADFNDSAKEAACPPMCAMPCSVIIIMSPTAAADKINGRDGSKVSLSFSNSFLGSNAFQN